MSFRPRLQSSAAALLLVAAATASAASSLSVEYFSVSYDDPDFDSQCCSSPADMVAGSLGPNGLPVLGEGYNDSAAFPISDLSADREITWWSPTRNANVAATGTATVTMPFENYAMYAPNATGSDDGAAFLTAVFRGNFELTAPAAVTFTLGSDDDAFFYVDGDLVVQNGGVHALDAAPVTTEVLAEGTHTLALFYADRYATGASLYFSIDTEDVTVTPEVPEPSEWMLLGGGLAFLSLAVSRTRRRR